jgi:2-polyprenyl-3-methyl-5-hydroxy-6-metoxy-1,4-benzoquinol methylase
MRYDPIKNAIGDVVRRSTWLRRLFYTVLGLMFLREWHVKRELRRLLNNRAGAKVYDAGCGFGQYSYYCARNFAHVNILAVDVKEDQLSDCRVFFLRAGITSVEFAVEDLTEIKHEGEFDLILAVDVMEHIPDDVSVFRNFYKAAKPGGRLLVNTPSDLGGSDVHSSTEASFIEEHARVGYGAEEIKRKLEQAGFEVEKIKYTYGTYGNLAWRLGIKYPMLMLNRSKLLFTVLPIYYVLVLPVVLPLMYLDYIVDNTTGSGLLVISRKP